MPLLQRSKQRTQVDVAACLDSVATEHIATLVQAGCLVSLFRTSDGGALGASVTLDGESEKEYHRLPEELHDWLLEVVQAVEAAPQDRPQRKRPAKRP